MPSNLIIQFGSVTEIYCLRKTVIGRSDEL